MNEFERLYQQKLCTPAQAAALVRSGDRVFIGFISSVSYVMAQALWDRRDELEDVEIGSSFALRKTPLFLGREPNSFRVATPFLGPMERGAQLSGRPTRFTSVHLSQVDRWFTQVAKPNVVFLPVSPMDEEGNFSFGPGGGCCNRYALETAERVVIHVNPAMPRIFGQSATIHVSQVDAIVEGEEPVAELPDSPADELSQQISANILPLIPDGATIQLGIGQLSTAIGYGLRDRNDLGIHTEMLCEPMMHLTRAGNVTNRCKGFMDGKSVYAFAMGSHAFYEYMNGNEELYAGLFPWVNDPRNIAKNKRMISINSAMSIDLFGQVASEAQGFRQHSACGGQVDFVRGAQWSEGGKSIIATASSFVKDGVRRSKIVLSFPAGTAVTTPRSDVQYVATEYGCVNLKDLNMDDRVRAMISLAHPDFRDQLRDQAREQGLI